jgi:DNA-binding response OmpR family regulator
MPRISVIDDDAYMRDLLRIHLSRAGMTVQVFEDAATGIRSLLETPPDLLVLDLMLPDLGGLEVLQALKADPASQHIPVIVLTSKTDDDTFTEAKRLGANAFLTKPIRREALIDSIWAQLV